MIFVEEIHYNQSSNENEKNEIREPLETICFFEFSYVISQKSQLKKGAEGGNCMLKFYA